jgi:hypothetical protein
MNNKSVSDYVAATMDAVLKSEAHQTLFGTKYASDENEAKKCSCGEDGCSCGDTQMASDELEVKEESCEQDSSCADDLPEDDNSAYDVAIDGLLSASAALDSIGFEKSAIISLNLASLIVEAKKKNDKKPAKKKPVPASSSKSTSSKSTSSKSTSSKSTSSKSTSSKSTPVKGKKPFDKKDSKKSSSK